MSPIFLDRGRRQAGPYLQWKVWSFSAGAVLAFAGMYFRSDWLVWAAIAVLLVGFLLRFAPHGEEAEEGGSDEI